MGEPQELTFESFLAMAGNFFKDPAGVILFIIFTAFLLFFFFVMTNKKVGNYFMGMVPGNTNKDEKGNSLPRTVGQKIGMAILITALAVLLYAAIRY